MHLYDSFVIKHTNVPVHHLSILNFSFEMENMFIIYLVVITALLISNSKACGSSCPCPFFGSSVNGGQKYPTWPNINASHPFVESNSPNGLRRGLDYIALPQLDSNVFEHCDMDRNGLTWNEVSSCIVSFLRNFDELKKYLALLLWFQNCILSRPVYCTVMRFAYF